MARLNRRQWGLRLVLVPAAVLLLALPWLGWQTYQTVQALSDRAEIQVLQSMGFTLARQLTASNIPLSAVDQRRTPVASVGFALQIDGFAEEWPKDAFWAENTGTRIYLAQHQSRLYWRIQTPTQRNLGFEFRFDSGDALRILSVNPTAARASWKRRRLPIQRWDQAGRTTLEFSMPIAGVPLDTQVQWGVQAHTLALHDPGILRLAQNLALDARQIRVTLPNQALVASTPALSGALLHADVPILRDGALIGRVQVQGPVPTAIQQLQTALGTLIGQISLIVLILSAGLIGWTTLLSRRIHRLRRELHEQLQRPTELAQSIRFSDASRDDEVGALGRDMQALLTELARYQAFLTQIPRTLRHELANPMSTLQTSLELLADEQDPGEQARLKQAAGRGIDKLNGTLTRITEAANLEESLRSDSPRAMNICQWLGEYGQSLVYLRQDIQWQLDVPDAAIWVLASEARLSQLLDKLIDNACDFTPPDGVIRIELTDQLFSVDLSVFNQGPAIESPENIGRRNLFASSRQDQTGQHLGLGLYVVDQIAQSMGAQLTAQNIDDGVRISVSGIAQHSDLH